MRSYILKAIIKRDFKETFRNPQSLIIIGITLTLNILLAVAVSKPLWLMTFSMSLVMVGFTITSFTVMEEKEKRTLEALLVSPANYSEILFGKLFVTFSTTVLITLGLVYSLHLKEISVVHTLLSVPIGAFIICLFGMVIGLICPSQAALSSFGTILMLILFLPELLASNNEMIGHLARALPTHHVIQISSLANEGTTTLILKHYAILILSFFATIYWVLSFVKTSAKQESSFIKIERSNIYSTLALIAVLSFGSFVLFPEKGKIVQFNGKTYYQKPEYRVSIPFDQKRYDLKEYRFQKKFIASLILKGSPENSIFLSVRKNIDNISAEQDLKETLEKVKKEKVFNLKVKEIPLTNKIVARRLSFEFKEGGSLLYLICVGEFLYRFGLELDDGRGEFDELSSELDLLVGGVLIGEG